MEIKTSEKTRSAASRFEHCPRHADIDHAWQVRPLTMRDSALRMLAISCAYWCGEEGCEAALQFSHAT